MNQNQPPFRMPCEAVAGKPQFFFGGPFSHSLAPNLHDKYVNITTVPNPNTDVGGSIPPYERWTPDDSGGLSCEVHHCVIDPTAAPCSQWLRPFVANTFANTPGDKVNFAVARKTGFKNIHARRFWSGVFGYLNKEVSNGPDHTQCCDGAITFAKWRGYSADVPATKYTILTITAESQEQQFNYDGSCNLLGTQVNWDDTASVSQSIDANTGLLSTTALSVAPNTDTNRALAALSEFGFMSWSDIVGRMTTNRRSPIGDAGTIIGTDNSITVTGDFTGAGGGIINIEEVTWDLAAGTFNRKFFDPDFPGPPVLVTEETFTVSDSEMAYAETEATYSTCGQATSAFTNVTATLSGENTSASIYTDIKNLLAAWPLSDDALYPWRNDLKVSVAPLVSRDEILTKSFNSGFFVRDYGNPIADVGGATIGDAGWTGHCGAIVSPDPNIGTKVVAFDLNVTSGDVVDETVDGFSFTTVTGYSVSGTLPPGVSFDSSTGHISGTAGVTGHFGVTITITGAVPATTGDILGSPKSAGYQNYFDFGYRDWVGCCYQPADNPGFQTWSWYQVGWGGNVSQFNIAAGCSLPLNATQWTNFFQAVNKPQGAFLFYNDPGQAYYPSDCVSSDAPSGVMDGDAL